MRHDIQAPEQDLGTQKQGFGPRNKDLGLMSFEGPHQPGVGEGKKTLLRKRLDHRPLRCRYPKYRMTISSNEKRPARRTDIPSSRDERISLTICLKIESAALDLHDSYKTDKVTYCHMRQNGQIDKLAHETNFLEFIPIVYRSTSGRSVV